MTNSIIRATLSVLLFLPFFGTCHAVTEEIRFVPPPGLATVVVVNPIQVEPLSLGPLLVLLEDEPFAELSPNTFTIAYVTPGKLGISAELQSIPFPGGPTRAFADLRPGDIRVLFWRALPVHNKLTPAPSHPVFSTRWDFLPNGAESDLVKSFKYVSPIRKH